MIIQYPFFSNSFGVKDIAYNSYELAAAPSSSAQGFLGNRKGYLLKVQFQSGHTGYSDLHAWPELGEAPVTEHLQSLKSLSPTGLAIQAIAAASVFDSLKNQNLELKSPANHHLLSNFSTMAVSDLERVIRKLNEDGFNKFKIKVGRDPQVETTKLNELQSSLKALPVKWRLDFNASLDRPALFQFLESLSPEFLDAIDFLEDPASADETQSWHLLKEKWDLKLASDREQPEDLELFDVFVVKATVENPFRIIKSAHEHLKRLVFTSNLAHPLGLAYDLVHASNTELNHPLLVDECGLLNHEFYGQSVFSQGFKTEGTQLVLQTSDLQQWAQELEKQKWKSLT